MGTFKKRNGIVGRANCSEDASGPGQCTVAFFGMSPQSTPNYNILYTDYDNFSVVYSCNPDTQLVDLWTLSRQPKPDADLFKSVLDIVAKKLPNYHYPDRAWNYPIGTYQGPQCDYGQQE